MNQIISRSCIQKVKSSFNIGDYIAHHTNLELIDGTLVGHSPLVERDEQRSLSVNVQKGKFHCKASGASGDIIAYEMALNGTSFVETVEFLAMLRGIELEYDDVPKSKQSTSIGEIVPWTRVRGRNVAPKAEVSGKVGGHHDR